MNVNKNQFALTPPMGWNSYDYYDTTVNETEVKENAAYMASLDLELGADHVLRRAIAVGAIGELSGKDALPAATRSFTLL